jgi:hypothetical protein
MLRHVISWGSNLVDVTVPAGGIASSSHANAPDLLHGPLRSQILLADKKDNSVHESKETVQVSFLS